MASKIHFLPLIEQNIKKKSLILNKLSSSLQKYQRSQIFKNLPSLNQNTTQSYKKQQFQNDDALQVAKKYLQKFSNKKLSYLQKNNKIKSSSQDKLDFLSKYFSSATKISPIKQIKKDKMKYQERSSVIISPTNVIEKKKTRKLKTEISSNQIREIKNLFSDHQYPMSYIYEKEDLLRKFSILKRNIPRDLQSELKILKYETKPMSEKYRSQKKIKFFNPQQQDRKGCYIQSQGKLQNSRYQNTQFLNKRIYKSLKSKNFKRLHQNKSQQSVKLSKCSLIPDKVIKDKIVKQYHRKQTFIETKFGIQPWLNDSLEN